LKFIISLAPYWILIGLVALFVTNLSKELSRSILLASVRTTVQLFILAFILGSLFNSPYFLVTLGTSILMTLNSSLHLGLKSKKMKKEEILFTFFTQIMALWPMAFVLSFDENNNNWMEAKNFLPLLGMLLGNSLNGVLIASENYKLSLSEKREEVLTLLALGASVKEANQTLFYRALKSGITPQINSMMAMGIVSIPGMMAGQLIAKADVYLSAMTQIKMMILILSGTILSVYIILYYQRAKNFTIKGELCLK
jgi:putative ABC transport system permease protein